jgi:hypothetical protein
MTQKNNMEKRIEETLNSLDSIQRAAPQPFFYTRLKARIEQAEKGTWEMVSSFITRPAMLFATVCMVLVLNAAILYKSHLSSAHITSEQLEQMPGDAYDVASNTNTTIYNIWSQDNNEQRVEK